MYQIASIPALVLFALLFLLSACPAIASADEGLIPYTIWADNPICSQDGKRYISINGKSVSVIETETGKELVKSSYDGEVRDVKMSPDGKKILIQLERQRGGTRWPVLFGYVETGKELEIEKDIVKSWEFAAFSPDSKKYTLAAGYIYDVETGTRGVVPCDDMPMRFSQDGKTGLFLKETKCYVFDVATGKKYGEFFGGAGSGGFFGGQKKVFYAAFLPDGKRLVTACVNGNCKIWDIETEDELASFRHPGKNDVGFEIAISPDGKKVVTIRDMPNTIAKIWDTQTGKELLELEGHTGKIISIAFSADSKRVATGSEDKTCRIWDATTGKELTQSDYDGNVSVVTFLANGNVLVRLTKRDERNEWHKIEIGTNFWNLASVKQGQDDPQAAEKLKADILEDFKKYQAVARTNYMDRRIEWLKENAASQKKLWDKASAAGIPEGQVLWGLYLENDGDDKTTIGRSLLEKAAYANNAEAQFLVGRDDIQKNRGGFLKERINYAVIRGAELLEKAVAQGHSGAKKELREQESVISSANSEIAKDQAESARETRTGMKKCPRCGGSGVDWSDILKTYIRCPKGCSAGYIPVGQ